MFLSSAILSVRLANGFDAVVLEFCWLLKGDVVLPPKAGALLKVEDPELNFAKGESVFANVEKEPNAFLAGVSNFGFSALVKLLPNGLVPNAGSPNVDCPSLAP